MSNNMGTNEQKVLGHALQSPYDVLTFLVGVKLRWLHGWGETWLNGPVSPLAISSRLGSTNLVTSSKALVTRSDALFSNSNHCS